MKFIYVTDEALSDSSVATVHIDQVCKSFVALGNTGKLFAPATTDFTIPAEYPVQFVRGGRWFSSIFFQVRLYTCLKSAVTTNRPDVIYIRHNYLLFVPAMIAKRFGIPLVMECNGRLLEEARLVERSVLGRVFLFLGAFRQIEAYNVRVASKLIAVAPGIRDYFLQRYAVSPEKVEVVLNGVDCASFKPADQAEARHELGLPLEAVYIGYIGSFYPWQGLRFIAEAAKEVVAQRPNVRFLIVGRGEDEEWLRAFVEENRLEGSVEVRPAVTHALVPTYINALDVCVCYPTTFRDGATSPFKVYEYLGCGKAVVLAEIGGMHEEFGDVVSYVEPCAPEVLCESLLALVDDKATREALGARGRAFIEAGRSWEAVTKKIVAICAAQFTPTR